MPSLFIASGIFHPEPGGPATYLHALLPGLTARGWSVRALTYGEGPVVGYPYPLQRIPRRAQPIRLAQYAWASRDPLRWADVVYAHTTDLPLLPLGRAPRLLKVVGDPAWERSVRRGWVPPDTDVDRFQTAALGALASLQRRARARQVAAFDAIIVPSAYLKRMVVGWGVDPARVHVVYNALASASEIAERAASQGDARARLGWDERPTLLAAARLTPWKGIDHLIHAVGQLQDVRLVVAGDGPEQARLRALAAPLRDRVVLLGRMPPERMPLLMQAADFFVLYSGYEGLPHTVLEALREGTPVIASDKGGNPEVVTHGVNGLLVPYIDRDALAEAIRNGLAAREALAAGTGIGLERFRIETMVDATHAILAGYATRAAG
jgi:glycosyltransferase involved in cell wall biosynthesis